MAGRFVRFESPERDHRGRNVGIFMLVNAAAKEGLLTPKQEAFRRANNDWYDANYTNPSHVDPTIYDHEKHPRAAAWFKCSATELIDRVDGYLDLCHELGIRCHRLESDDPGVIIYEDESQIVVIPCA